MAGIIITAIIAGITGVIIGAAWADDITDTKRGGKGHERD